MADSLLDRRLIVVTGKGGVGKSTVAAALALCASRRGKRVLCCEINTKERIPDLLGAPAGTGDPREREIAPGVFSVNVVPAEAMREYALMKLKFETIYKAVFENRVVRAFLRMIPSLAETVMLGKVWFEVMAEENGRPRWDLVVLDAPATGHGISLLRVPQVLMDTVPPGAMREDAQRMYDTLTDPALTSLQIVTFPEEMPVNETLELEQQVRDVLGIPLGRLFLNAFVPRRFNAEEVADFGTRATGGEGTLSLVSAAAHAGLVHGSRAEMSEHYESRLAVQIPEMPIVTLPRLYTATWGRQEIDTLTGVIDTALGESP